MPLKQKYFTIASKKVSVNVMCKRYVKIDGSDWDRDTRLNDTNIPTSSGTQMNLDPNSRPNDTNIPIFVRTPKMPSSGFSLGLQMGMDGKYDLTDLESLLPVLNNDHKLFSEQLSMGDSLEAENADFSVKCAAVGKEVQIEYQKLCDLKIRGDIICKTPTDSTFTANFASIIGEISKSQAKMLELIELSRVLHTAASSSTLQRERYFKDYGSRIEMESRFSLNLNKKKTVERLIDEAKFKAASEDEPNRTFPKKPQYEVREDPDQETDEDKYLRRVDCSNSILKCEDKLALIAAFELIEHKATSKIKCTKRAVAEARSRIAETDDSIRECQGNLNIPINVKSLDPEDLSMSYVNMRNGGGLESRRLSYLFSAKRVHEQIVEIFTETLKSEEQDLILLQAENISRSGSVKSIMLEIFNFTSEIEAITVSLDKREMARNLFREQAEKQQKDKEDRENPNSYANYKNPNTKAEFEKYCRDWFEDSL